MASLTTIKGGGSFSRQNIRNINANFTALNASAIVGTLTSAHILVGNGSNVATDTAVTGDVTITNAGVTAIKTSVSLTTPVLGAATGTSLVLTGDCRAATFHAGATAGVTAGPYTTVSSIATIGGLVTTLTGT
jgi:hypothetical protein